MFLEPLRGMLADGGVVFRSRPTLKPGDRSEAMDLLAAAYANHALDVAGPAIPFDPDVALAAAVRTLSACWFLVHRGEEAAAVREAMAAPPPQTASDHICTDLLYRFLPRVHRRARAAAADDALTLALKDLLRAHPLSGVSADLPEGPSGPVQLGGHPGLLLLYAERLASEPQPAWVVAGPSLPYVELAFAERKLPKPVVVESVQREVAP